MDQDNDSGPPPIDTKTPSVARMHDYLLGGTDNYPADRRACAKLLRVAPDIRALALNNRAFLRRAVRVLAREHGIRQFLDHGSGLPTRDNVHQVARAVHPDCRVVYVDNDPTAEAHGRTLLDENDGSARFLRADLRQPDAILDHRDLRATLDLERPVAALFVSVLHCIPEHDDPKAIVRRVAERLRPGSFVLVCQLVSHDARAREAVTRCMDEATGGRWGAVRSPSAVDAFLEGLDVEPPGLTEVTEWHPDTEPRVLQGGDFIEYGGLARIP
ncbi:SAM-dependent methyltransferase [Embleya sp. NPDC059237]|uniref:SAM-dependent methyltransferase n=1 Tax=Embleya sp. NPDC059237 TaxID=3346784 RepID=UPI003685BDA8